MDLFQQFLNRATQGYKQADKALGGWLPEGGTASPATKALQPVKKAINLANVRDAVLIPVLDKGLSTGVVPPVEGMYARFLSGTSKPLTELPPALKTEIPNAYNEALQPRERTNPVWFSTFLNNYSQISKQFSDPTTARMLAIQAANESNIPRTTLSGSKPDSSGNVPVIYSDYETGENKSAISKTLGRFHINPTTNEVLDRYDFNYYMPGAKELSTYTNPTAGVNMLIQEKEPRGAIPIAHFLGLIKPGAGYEIKAPLK